MKVSVTVKPGSKKGPLIEAVSEDLLQVYVKEQAAEGRANKAMIELLAKYYSVPKSQIKITSGHTSKRKIIDIG